MDKALLIAQISDAHVGMGAQLLGSPMDPLAALQQGVEHLLTMDPTPDVVLFTGDLTEHGAETEYALVAQTLAALTMPVYAVPGNHDSPQLAQRSLLQYMPVASDAPSGTCCYHVQHGALHLIALDSVVPHRSHGALSTAQLDWLHQQLSSCAGEAVLLFMHHPPMPTGLEVMDACSLLEGGDRLAQLIRNHGHVHGLLCGHLHRPVNMMFGGVSLHVAPSVAHQIELNLRPGAPLCARLEPPKVSLHRWTPATGLCTHTSYIGDFGPGIPL